MLSASSQCVGRSPLSPLTQTTLEKHLPGLPTKRFLQQNKVLKVDVGCITGTNPVHESRRLNFIFCFYPFALLRIQLNHVPSENWHKHMRRHYAAHPKFVSLACIRICFFLFLGAFVQSHDRAQSISIFLMRIQTNGISTLSTFGTLNSLNICALLPKKKARAAKNKSCPFGSF